jgi:hypothetical protein
VTLTPRVGILCMFVAAMAGCGGPHTSDGYKRNSSSAAEIAAPAQDKPAPIRIVSATRIAEHEIDHPLHLVRFHGFVGADRRGRMFIYNEVLQRAEVFDVAGKLEGLRGQRGGGPGEYRYPASLHVAPDGALDVFDQGKNAIVRFAADGGILPERSLVGLKNLHGGARIWGDTLILYDRSIDSAGRPVHVLRALFEGKEFILASVVPPTRGASRFQCPGFSVTTYGAEELFAPQLQWAEADRLIAVAVTNEYVVRVYSGTRLLRTIHRPAAKIPTSRADVDRLHPEGIVFGRPSCRLKGETLIEGFGLAEFLPTLGRLAIAPDSSLWVERYRLPEDPSAIDLYDREGSYQGTLSGSGFPIAFLARGAFIGVIADKETGGQQVLRYRVEPAPW